MRLAVIVICASLAASASRAEVDLSGTWVIADSPESGDTYGELRVVRHAEDAIRVSMIDYSAAWVEGAFRPVVRIMPWTFTVDDWAPRRGGRTSHQPRARARHAGEALILEKSTNSGNGNFRWSWRIDATGNTLLHHDLARQPDDVTRFGRLGDERTDKLEALDAIGNIVIRPAVDRERLLITCPASDCRIIQFQSGIQIGATKLPRTETLGVSLDAEVRVEPVVAK